jgi:hypothetical protein
MAKTLSLPEWRHMFLQWNKMGINKIIKKEEDLVIYKPPSWDLIAKDL